MKGRETECCVEIDADDKLGIINENEFEAVVLQELMLKKIDEALVEGEYHQVLLLCKSYDILKG